MNEEWKDIKGFEGLYKISSLGRVMSLHPHGCKDTKEYIKVPDSIHNGYLRVELHRKGRRKIKMLVHRLVAEAFIENPEGKREVNHKDCNKHNNTVSNLEWCSHKENMKHAYDNGRVDPHHAISVRWEA